MKEIDYGQGPTHKAKRPAGLRPWNNEPDALLGDLDVDVVIGGPFFAIELSGKGRAAFVLDEGEIHGRGPEGLGVLETNSLQQLLIQRHDFEVTDGFGRPVQLADERDELEDAVVVVG